MIDNPKGGDAAERNRSGFPTTHWSVVLDAGAGSESQAQAALEVLCSRYWYPLYCYTRRQGRSHHEAEDCTQEFLARLLAADGMARAQPERGRFRTFLLTALRNFLTNEWQRAQTAKRGGGHTLVSLDWNAAGERFAHEPVDARSTPEQAFDRAWAQQLMERAIGELRADYEKRRQGELFHALGGLVWASETRGAHADHAARLAMTPHAFTVALQRLRQRIGERLRAAIAETVTDPADVDAELRHLIAIVGERQ
jgi:RNA polymerase sigma factor (sigma-70 family)